MSNTENVCPERQTSATVARELRRLVAHPPPGVKIQLRDDDLTDVIAVLEGPADTPYAGGVFRVRLVLGREYPRVPPRAMFLTRVFHPNVSGESGEVCVNTLQRDWRPELGLSHVLLTLRCLLIAPNAESALNAEAAALLRDKYDDYFTRAKLLTDIHARPRPHEGCSGEEGPCAKRDRRAPPSSGTSSASSHSTTAPAKDKRRILKRL